MELLLQVLSQMALTHGRAQHPRKHRPLAQEDDASALIEYRWSSAGATPCAIPQHIIHARVSYSNGATLRVHHCIRSLPQKSAELKRSVDSSTITLGGVAGLRAIVDVPPAVTSRWVAANIAAALPIHAPGSDLHFGLPLFIFCAAHRPAPPSSGWRHGRHSSTS
jgi:hypothetical protein